MEGSWEGAEEGVEGEGVGCFGCRCVPSRWTVGGLWDEVGEGKGEAEVEVEGSRLGVG